MPKNLVLCCDGTWNTADQTDKNGELCATNVVKIACRLKKRTRTGDLQIVYYDQGVGTGNALDRVSGGAFGDGLEANIHDAYRFLIANYEPGDRIYLFGFSRGAFTARSIAGMIRKCGILKRESVREYPRTKAFYRNAAKPGDQESIHFRRTYAIEPETPVHCVGVWDTVGALGIPLRGLRSMTQRDVQFHDTELSRAVKFAFHALALDEHRAPFEPALWSNAPADGQTVEQVWFAGAHSDVGGGYAQAGLSDIALDWMMDRAEKLAGLETDPGVRTVLKTNPNPKQDPHDSKTGLYNLTAGIDRPVGTKPSEALHRSVLERWRDVPSWRPKSLKKYAPRIDAWLAGPMDAVSYPL